MRRMSSVGRISKAIVKWVDEEGYTSRCFFQLPIVKVVMAQCLPHHNGIQYMDIPNVRICSPP